MTIEELRSIITDIKMKNREVTAWCMGKGFYLQLTYSDICTETDEFRVQKGRKWYISSFATRSEVVQTVLKAALTSAEHEVREHFRYRGRAVFGPHFNVDRLWEVAGEEIDRR